MGIAKEAMLEKRVIELEQDEGEPPGEDQDGAVGAWQEKREGAGDRRIEQRDGAIAPHHGLEQIKSDFVLSRGGDLHSVLPARRALHDPPLSVYG
jgi:hypothetical protein